MTFKHNFLPRTEINATTTEAGRVYHTPVGDLPSVTTVIGRKLDHGWLDKWKERVGENVAAQISHQAANRGTAVHELAEKYMMNDPHWAKRAMPANVFSFKQIKPILDENIDVVYGIEYPLYSTLLNTAGRTDLPARFRGINTICDFKTSRREKARDDIHGYFIQSTCYSLMMEERTGMKFPQIAIIITVDNGPSQLFVERSRDWYDAVRTVFCE